MTKEVQQTLRHLDQNDILLPWAHAMQGQITAACSIRGDQSNPYLICSSKSCFGVDALQYLMTEVEGSQDIDRKNRRQVHDSTVRLAVNQLRTMLFCET